MEADAHLRRAVAAKLLRRDVEQRRLQGEPCVSGRLRRVEHREHRVAPAVGEVERRAVAREHVARSRHHP